MSLRNINRTIFLYSGLTGKLILSMSLEEYLENGYARDYFLDKIDSNVRDDKEVYLRFGFNEIDSQ